MNKNIATTWGHCAFSKQKTRSFKKYADKILKNMYTMHGGMTSKLGFNHVGIENTRDTMLAKRNTGSMFIM